VKHLFYLLAHFAISLSINAQLIDSSEIKKLSNSAEFFFNNLKYDSASVYYNRLEKLYETQRDWLLCATTYRLNSNAMIKIAKYDSALSYIKKALDIAETSFLETTKEEMTEKTEILLGYSCILEDKGEYQQALTFCNKALEIYLKTDSLNKLLLTDIWDRKGLCFEKQYNFDSALYYGQKALEGRMKLLGEKNKKIADSYTSLGIICYSSGDLNKALKFHLLAYEILTSFTNDKSPELVPIYDNIGMAYAAKGEYDNALNYYEKALRVPVPIPEEQRQELSLVYSNIAEMYDKKDDYDKALEYLFRALKIDIAIRGEKFLYIPLHYLNIGTMYFKKRNYEKALTYLETSMQKLISDFGEDSYYVGYACINTGLVYDYIGNAGKTLEYYQKSLKILIKIIGEQNETIGKIYGNIALVYEEQGEHEKALEYNNKSLQILISVLGEKHPDVANVYNNLGDYYTRKEDYKKSLYYYQKSLLANLPEFTDTSIYANPRLSVIFRKPELVRTLAEKANSLYQLYRTESNSIIDIKASLFNYELAFEIINNMRSEYNIENSKLSLSERNKNYYALATHVALEYEKTEISGVNLAKAFEFIEKGKSATLAAQFNEYNAKSFAGIPKLSMEKEKELKKKISDYSVEIENEKYRKEGYDTIKINLLENKKFVCSRQLDSLIFSFEKNYPVYYQIKYKDKIASIPEIKKSLDKKTALLSYFIGDASLYISIFTDSLFFIKEEPIDSSFSQKVKKYYKILKTAEPEELVLNSFYLYEKLIEPVKNYIDKKDKLVIIPDDYLFYVPFETLICSDNRVKVNPMDFSNLNYLIKTKSVTYNHSATLWYNSQQNETDQTKRTQINFVGFAPVFGDKKNNGIILSSNLNVIDTTGHNLAYRSVSADMKKFNPLPYSEDEVTSILHLFENKKKDAKVYLYTDASELNFKNNAGKYTYVHISSHGFSNDKDPKLSGIVFSQPDSSVATLHDPEDGILYAGETYNLNLKADLVVLSSCESGLGKLIKGEGIQALSRGFLSAGTPNIIFSLWKALDKPTKELMIDFYSYLLGGESYAEALRKAKLNLINNSKTAFPHFWGGFVLMGR
jgi:CHAT domain-containing protein